MTELPEPMTPPDCDLRGMPYMPFDVIRLLDSDLYALSTGDEFKAAFTLWGKSFYQIPAGSLPADEKLLEHLSGSKRWKAVREMALRGWIKCSDGRLYHKTVSEKCKEAWAARLSRRERTEAARAARHSAKVTSDIPPVASVTTSVTENVTTSVTESKGREGKGREEERKKDTEASPLASACAAPLPLDARTELWREGLAIIRRLTGKPENVSRAFLGRVLRDLGDNCDQGMQILLEADSLRPVDPEAWIVAAAKARSPKAVPKISARKEKILRAGGLWDQETSMTIDATTEKLRILQ